MQLDFKGIISSFVGQNHSMHHPYVNTAITAVRAASKTIIQYFDRLDRLKLTENSNHTFRSEADVQAEDIIVHAIKAAYPYHTVLTATSGAEEAAGSTSRWMIDSLNGVDNFIHGIPHFCISISVEIQGKIEHSVILDPLRQELFVASRGRGAYLNNKRLRVARTQHLEKSMLAMHVPHARDSALYPAYLKIFGACLAACAHTRHTGSAALDLAYVAAGRFDGCWAHGLPYWQSAAGTLLIAEAGGFVSDFNGGDRYVDSGNIVTATPKIFKRL